MPGDLIAVLQVGDVLSAVTADRPGIVQSIEAQDGALVGYGTVIATLVATSSSAPPAAPSATPSAAARPPASASAPITTATAHYPI